MPRRLLERRDPFTPDIVYRRARYFRNTNKRRRQLNRIWVEKEWD